jgi:hypothetical protein
MIDTGGRFSGSHGPCTPESGRLMPSGAQPTPAGTHHAHWHQKGTPQSWLKHRLSQQGLERINADAIALY